MLELPRPSGSLFAQNSGKTVKPNDAALGSSNPTRLLQRVRRGQATGERVNHGRVERVSRPERIHNPDIQHEGHSRMNL